MKIVEERTQDEEGRDDKDINLSGILKQRHDGISPLQTPHLINEEYSDTGVLENTNSATGTFEGNKENLSIPHIGRVVSA